MATDYDSDETKKPRWEEHQELTLQQTLSIGKISRITFSSLWFKTKPCFPASHPPSQVEKTQGLKYRLPMPNHLYVVYK